MQKIELKTGLWVEGIVTTIPKLNDLRFIGKVIVHTGGDFVIRVIKDGHVMILRDVDPAVLYPASDEIGVAPCPGIRCDCCQEYADTVYTLDGYAYCPDCKNDFKTRGAQGLVSIAFGDNQSDVDRALALYWLAEKHHWGELNADDTHSVEQYYRIGDPLQASVNFALTEMKRIDFDPMDI